jgi:hypothetical protein
MHDPVNFYWVMLRVSAIPRRVAFGRAGAGFA